MQERLIVLWDLLQERGFIDAETVIRRIDLNESNTVVAAVREAFFLFEFAHDFSDAAVTGPKANFPSDTLFGRLEQAVTWLVVLILRTDDGANVEGAIRFTQETGLLGDFDVEAEVEEEDEDSEFKGSKYLLYSGDASRTAHRIGMILSHRENFQRWASETILRYADLRCAYRDIFGPDS